MNMKMPMIMIIAFLILTACASDYTNNETANSSEKIEQITTTIKGGRVGGAWSVFTEGVAESVRRTNKGSYITVEPGGIIENPLYIGIGRVPFSLSYSMTAYAAYRGDEPYDQAYEDIRAVSVVVPANHYQFFVREDLPYETLDELLENQEPIRLAVDQHGAAGELMTREILKQYEVTYDDIVNWGGSIDYVSGSKGFEMMADRRIDAIADAESAPSGTIIEAATTIDLKMFSLNEKTIQTVTEELGMETSMVSANTYSFQSEDVQTISTPAILLAHKDVSDEEVYAVTKAIFENLDYLDSVHEEFKELTIENMARVGEVPLHPGALKFYQEMGLAE